MHTSTPDTSPVGVHPSGANAVINGTPPETSPSSLTLDDEELTRTVHFTYAGQSITFEIVNKRVSLIELDPSVEEVEAIPDGGFGRILKTIFCCCISF